MIALAKAPDRAVFCQDAIPFLADYLPKGAVITSPPGPDEMRVTPAEWSRAIGLCLAAALPEAPAILYLTDSKGDGQLTSKSAIAHHEAQRLGMRCLWHKIALRRAVGAIDLHRPGFTHLMAFSQKGRPGQATADVIHRGEMLYPNAMGLNAAHVAVRACEGFHVLDPFCGKGTVLAMANALGLSATGIDIDPQQCEEARKLRLSRG